MYSDAVEVDLNSLSMTRQGDGTGVVVERTLDCSKSPWLRVELPHRDYAETRKRCSVQRCRREVVVRAEVDEWAS